MDHLMKKWGHAKSSQHDQKPLQVKATLYY